jgi:hypothetical protein
MKEIFEAIRQSQGESTETIALEFIVPGNLYMVVEHKDEYFNAGKYLGVIGVAMNISNCNNNITCNCGKPYIGLNTYLGFISPCDLVLNESIKLKKL